jgi:uncharacterized membrane protein YccC
MTDLRTLAAVVAALVVFFAWALLWVRRELAATRGWLDNTADRLGYLEKLQSVDDERIAIHARHLDNLGKSVDLLSEIGEKRDERVWEKLYDLERAVPQFTDAGCRDGSGRIPPTDESA